MQKERQAFFSLTCETKWLVSTQLTSMQEKKTAYYAEKLTADKELHYNMEMQQIRQMLISKPDKFVYLPNILFLKKKKEQI